MNFILNKEKLFFFLFLLLLFVYIIYIKILYPAFALNDSPETITAIYTLGIPHPPGYPLFNLIGKVFLSIKLGSPAFNINLFSVFLSVISLLILFFLVKMIYNEDRIAFISIFIQAFSYGFLKEAIQAKGGIYILNLIFIEIIIFIIISLLEEFSFKKIYLLFFVYFLSLANHWQTMIFFLPVILYILILFFKKFKFKNYLFILFLMFIGLSPYLYLLIRASSVAVLNHGNPDNFLNLLKHIFRINYTGEFESLSAAILSYQLNEFIKVSVMSYSFLIILFFIRLFCDLKNRKKISIILFLFFIINILSVLFFFRRRQDSSCYYLPAVFISSIFIAGALNCFYNLKNKFIKNFLFIVFFMIFIIIAVNNYKISNNSRNYLSYDYINNIFKTIDKNSLYIASSDFDINPVFYMKHILKRREDIKVIFFNFLAFEWGIEQFQKDFEDFKESLEIKKPGKNIIKIIKHYYDNENIYAGYNNEAVKKIGFLHRQEGLILATGRKIKEPLKIDFYKIYSYRGIFNKNYQKTGDSLRLISNYAGNMVNYASEFLKAGNIDKAIELYEKAIKLPFHNSRKGFYYNLYTAYKIKGDIKMAQKYFDIAKNEE